MICTTCGADNPGHLTFCRECGQRLAARIAPPTPPVGMAPPAAESAPSPLAATALAPSNPPPASQPPGARHRPTAPEMSFRPRSDQPPPVAPVAPVPPPAATGATVPCPLCGSTNQAGLRFCVTCGQSLAGPPAAAAMRGPIDLSRTVPEPPRFVEPAPAPPQPTPPPIAPVRVVGLGAPEAPPMQRLCPRCRGASDGAAQFCRFCGASLAEAQSVALQPSPNPISSPPPPIQPGPPPPLPIPPTAPGTPHAQASGAVAGKPPALARLVLIARDGGEGPSFSLRDSADIGRVEGGVVIPEDRYISPRHARISLRSGVFYLRDLESTNGVFMRIPFEAPPQAGQAEMPSAGEQLLADQDLFLVGQQVLRFEVVKHAEEGFGVASENGTLVFGSPAAPRYARLSQRTVEGVVRDVFHVRKTETVLGREQGDIVFPDDPFLSRRHCMLRVHGVTPGSSAGAYPPGGARERAPGRFTLSDLGSSNGTFLQVREEVRLRPGDHFRIGQQLFRFDT